ncbi:hypothetical protein HMPREF6123_0084 [Oribacterium sinus F0268]|uniref:Uncharacterized protein n=1 Tax=Oribacterium sinus F0268 TaxID=585501 RepID=C2KUB5_9FIRM|nr:hypothetical protein HMPREF6123_0084 [Oribacterium sinus F0268]
MSKELPLWMSKELPLETKKKANRRKHNASSLHPFGKSIKKFHFGKIFEIPFGKSI